MLFSVHNLELLENKRSPHSRDREVSLYTHVVGMSGGKYIKKHVGQQTHELRFGVTFNLFMMVAISFGREFLRVRILQFFDYLDEKCLCQTAFVDTETAEQMEPRHKD
jgi:hypothetical protein